MVTERYPCGTILAHREQPHVRARVDGKMYIKATKFLVLSAVPASGQEMASEFSLPEKEIDKLYEVVGLGPVTSTPERRH